MSNTTSNTAFWKRLEAKAGRVTNATTPACTQRRERCMRAGDRKQANDERNAVISTIREDPRIARAVAAALALPFRAFDQRFQMHCELMMNSSLHLHWDPTKGSQWDQVHA